MAGESPLLATREDAARIARVVRAIENARGNGCEIRLTGDTLVISVLPLRGGNSGGGGTSGGGGGVSGVVRMQIAEIFNDHLRCRMIEGAAPDSPAGDTDYLVAKPLKLRHQASIYPQLDSLTTIDAQNVTAAATGYESELWRVNPRYVVGQTLFAEALPVSGTGLEVSGERLVWMDANVDGRAWGVVEES